MAYSILSLDGGGTWALIQVRVLQQRYGAEIKGRDVLKKYDLVIANSGGSLVLAAMCADKKLSEIADIFLNEEKVKTIFSRKNNIRSTVFGLERFSTEKKKEGLKNILGPEASGKLMTELPAFIGKESLQIIITGFDYDKQRAVYFRSNALSAMESWQIEKAVTGKATENFKTVTLLDAIHASSNAPVLFFDKPAQATYQGVNAGTEPRLFWDGAVGGNNNPVTSGLLEAMANGVKKEEIRIITLGTGNNVYPVYFNEPGEPGTERVWLLRKSKMLGEIAELKEMANAIVADPPDAATFTAHQILGLEYKENNNKLIRINPLIKAIFSDQENKWKCPGNNWNIDKDLFDLFDMDMAVTDTDKLKLLDKLCTDFFAGYFDNQGIRIGGKKSEAILGHKKFAAAKEDWESWDAAPPI